MIEVRRQSDGLLLGHLDIPMTVAFEAQALLFPTDGAYAVEDLNGQQTPLELQRVETVSTEGTDVNGKPYRTNVVIVRKLDQLEALRASGLFREAAS